MKIRHRIVYLGFWTILLTACSGSDNNKDAIVSPPNDEGLKLVQDILVPPGFIVEEFATGLELPTTVAFPPDGSNRLFVNELQSGRIKIIQDGKLNALPFTDVETMVMGGFPSAGENGLIGLTFDPDYVANRYVYVTFAVRTPNGTLGKVARMKDQNNRAVGFEILLDNLPSAPGHQIENLAFGPDGKLYVSVGDAFEQDKAQDLNQYNGKILRLNSDGSIPADNPNPNSYVWASGLRNSFGLAFRENGDLLATENGPDMKDELNVIVKGGNYGWPIVLGISAQQEFVNPIFVWENIVSPNAILFYKGSQFPQNFKGKMFTVLFGSTFSDGPSSIAKRIRVGTFQGSGLSSTVIFEDFATYNFDGKGNPLGLTQGPDGMLYLSDIFQGKIFRIRFGNSGTPL